MERGNKDFLDGGGSGAAYVRVSSLVGEDGGSLDAQREEVLALADTLGVTVAPGHVICDVGSGNDAERPGMIALWRFVESKGVQNVLVYDVNRLGRNPQDVLRFARHCDDHRVALRIVKGYQ